MKPLRSSAVGASLLLCISTSPATVSADWSPAPGPLMTRWGRQVTPGNAHRDYPRPQMVRDRWVNLNGLWDYAIRPAAEDSMPESFDGKILVPFPVESALSGVMKPVAPDQALWYRRTWTAPKMAAGERLLLHFGAVDWSARVWVNGRQVGDHAGGYAAFSFDITAALRPAGVQQIVVKVVDPTDRGYQPRGKQVLKPHGIWYSAVTGIWQTVWLEPVPKHHITSMRVVPDIDAGEVHIAVATTAAGQRFSCHARSGTLTAQSGPNPHQIVLNVPQPRLWSPESPYLYPLDVTLRQDDRVVDKVTGYFGMRKIEVRKDRHGVNRLMLNNRPLFQLGPLDQGWWPDGLYTAPSDEALRYDVAITRKLGFNAIRKHVKIEPARWYLHCDQLGVLVWQDMPSGDRYIHGNMPDIARSKESAAAFQRELKAMIDGLFNHPCVVMWVAYNEGWGQWQTERVVRQIKTWDPTRLVDNASGWTDRGVGDVHDIHRYPGPAMPKLEANRAAVLGEFGGLGLPVKGHLWTEKKNWGYRTFQDRDALLQGYEKVVGALQPLVARGLSAAIYTQTTDVEREVNGLMTYDRAVLKYDSARLEKLHRRLYGIPDQPSGARSVPAANAFLGSR